MTTKEEKELEGVCRGTLCKWVAGGAAAIGGSCLLPALSWKVGKVQLLGVQLAEGGADLSQVSILARREIEARILMPVLNAFIREYGKEQTVKLIEPVIQNVAKEGGVQLAAGSWREHHCPFRQRAFVMDPGRCPLDGCFRAN